VLRARPRPVEPIEEPTELVRARPLGILEQPLDELRKAALGHHLEVLREHAPDALEDEAPQRLGVGGVPFAETVVEVGDEDGRLARQLSAVLGKARLATAEEVERLVVVGQLVEVERRERYVPASPGLEDLELAELADHHETPDVAGLALNLCPVVERLLTVLGELVRLARTLHLDDADAGPDHVHEPDAGALLEARSDLLAVGAVAGEQLVEKRLGLGPLRAPVVGPALDDLREVLPDLLPVSGTRRRLEAQLRLWDGEEGALRQLLGGLGEILLDLLERLD